MFNNGFACSISIISFSQVAVLTKKLDAQSQLSVLRRRGDEPTKQLHFEIQRLKAYKVTFC